MSSDRFVSTPNDQHPTTNIQRESLRILAIWLGRALTHNILVCRSNAHKEGPVASFVGQPAQWGPGSRRVRTGTPAEWAVPGSRLKACRIAARGKRSAAPGQDERAWEMSLRRARRDRWSTLARNRLISFLVVFNPGAALRLPQAMMRLPFRQRDGSQHPSRHRHLRKSPANHIVVHANLPFRKRWDSTDLGSFRTGARPVGSQIRAAPSLFLSSLGVRSPVAHYPFKIAKSPGSTPNTLRSNTLCT